VNNKFISLVFDYDFLKMYSSGRVWAKEGYKNRDNIFEYAAASIATVLNHNKKTQYDVLTDNRELLLSKISQYDVNCNNLNVVENSELIKKWSQHEYCFWPIVEYYSQEFCEHENVIKLDNDLTCLKNCDDLFNLIDDNALMWKFERKCSDGKLHWGEKYAAEKAFNTSNFDIHNMGIFALPQKFHTHKDELKILTQKLIDVDISSIVKFSEGENIRVKIWSCSEQTAYNYFCSKHRIPIIDTTQWFEHHCYEKTKLSCVMAAKYLKK